MKRHKTICIIFTILVLVPFTCLGITLDDAVRYALENGESASIVRREARETLEAGRSAGAFARPGLSLSGSWTELTDNADAATEDREITGEATLSQTIYAAGKLRDSRALEKNYSHRSELQEIIGNRDIVRRVKTLFVNVLHRQEELAIFQDRNLQRKMELEDATDLRDNGYATSLDVRQAMQSLNVSVSDLVSAERQLSDALIDFNTALGLPPGESPKTPRGDLALAPDMAPMLDAIEGRLETGELLDLRSDDAIEDGAMLDYRIAGAELFPRASVFLSGKTQGHETDGMTESVAAGVNLEWDIFSGGLNRSNKAAALARLKKAEDRSRLTQKELKAEVKSLGLKRTEVETKVKLQKESVALAKENYEDARGHYRAGTITLTRLGEFSLSYAEARFTLQSLFVRQRELAFDLEQLLYR